ncbi:MAG: anthranilate phosphoribosyltransferase, partial [Angustibacter sp.]
EMLRGGDAAHNAGVVRAVLAGDVGPVRDAVLLNAGMALATVAGLDGVDPSQESVTAAVRTGMTRAAAVVDSGAAAALLERWVAYTAELAG